MTAGSGEVVVTGASGGVGSLAVALLAKAGYTVVASTGKPQAAPLLAELGAARIVARAEVDDRTDRPLLPSQWAAAVDAVGGSTLATLVRSTGHRGVVAACGLVGGAELPLTVYPFLLRGVRLDGIDSAWTPPDERAEIWERLAGEWKLDCLPKIAREITLEALDENVAAILAGKIVGRVVVKLPQ